jgi:addiction module HigA family antidote
MSARKGGALGPALPAGVPSRHPVHPGRMLERLVLQPLSLSQSETARQLGISRRRVNELVQGQRAMSPDTAIRCALAFGLDASFWLGLQARWDSYHHWRSLRQASPPVAAPASAHLSVPAPRG